MSLKPAYLLIEALVAAAMLGIVLAAIIPSLSLLNTKASRSSFETEATGILVEGIEVSYNVALAGWSVLSPGVYRKSVAFGKWILEPATNESINSKYTRTIQIQPVCRHNGTGILTTPQADGSCPPASSLDTNSKNIFVKVEWDEPGGHKFIDSQLLIYNY